MCTFVGTNGSVRPRQTSAPAVRGRVLLVVCLLAAAGCSSAPAGAPDATETVTPAPVPTPESTDADAGAEQGGPDGPAIEDGVVDGRTLAARQERSLSAPHTRTLEFRVEDGDRTLFRYRERRTVVGEEKLVMRRYEGPTTARFVPGSRNATAARERRLVVDGNATRQQFVDGQHRDEDVSPPLVAPVDGDPGTVGVLLEGAAVTSRTRSLGFQVARDGVDPAAVPEFLGAVDADDGRVRATVRDAGRVTRLVVRYGATLDGRRVAVTRRVAWSGTARADLEPGRTDD